MRIAILANTFPALSETFILRQVVDLLRAGHDVRVIAGRPTSGEPEHAEVRAYGLRERTTYWPQLPENSMRRFANLAGSSLPMLLSEPRAVWEALHPRRNGPQWRSGRFLAAGAAGRFLRQRFDVIHCHFGTLGLVGLYLRRCGFLEGPILTSFHGADVSVSPRKWGPDVYAPLFRSDAWFTVNSKHTLGRVEALGAPKDRIRLVRMGINLSSIEFQARSLAPGEPIRLLSIARLTEKKGLCYALEAVHALIAQGIPIRYQIVGDGPLRGELTTSIRRLRLEAHVELVGWRTADEVRKILDTAHILVQPSVTNRNGDEEGQGVVLQEAQAAGMPVVATRHNGFPEGLLEGKSGLLVEERDSAALASAIQRLIDTPEQWPAMGQAGRKFVAERFDSEKLAVYQQRIYGALAAGEPPPEPST